MKKVLLILSIMIVVLALASCGHIHLPGEKLAIEQEPTCTKDGLGYIYCLECGEVAKIVVIPATGTHKVETIPAQEATCTEKGTTEGERCSECGEIFVDPQEIPVIPHVYDDKYDETCNECGHVRDAECAHIEKEVIEGKDATCTKIGYTDGERCKKCGETVTAQEVIPMLDHSYSSVVTAPTCTAQGYTTYTCGCGDSYIDIFVDKIPHSFGEWKVVKEATKTEEGLKERSCSCGEKETKTIDIIKISEGLQFELNSDGKGYSVIDIGSCGDTDVVIPDTYNGLPVTSIGEDAFLYCTSLTSIQIPSSVTSIGEWVFAYCTSLERVEVPDSLTSIGVGAFYNCESLMSIEIPDSVTSIGESVFAYCTSLERVEVPDSVTSIGRFVFNSCISLTSIEVDTNNKYYKSIDGNLYTKNGKTLIQYAIGKEATSFTIPNSVTTIGDFAFTNCKFLTSVVIPDSVTSIGNYAFDGSNSLTSIDVGNSVTKIGDRAFGCCSSLTNIDVDTNNKYYKSIDGNLYTKNGKTLIQYAIGKEATSFTIPNSVTTIGDSAFYCCKFITSVTIPNSVTSIGYDAFWCCISLTSIVIPDSVTSIDNQAFAYCYALENIEIPDSVTSIGGGAFSDCISLTSLDMGNSVTSIDQWTFNRCYSLTSIKIPESVRFIHKEAFKDCTSLVNIEFKGTVSQWISIEKNYWWHDDIPAKEIACSNGTVIIK